MYTIAPLLGAVQSLLRLGLFGSCTYGAYKGYPLVKSMFKPKKDAIKWDKVGLVAKDGETPKLVDASEDTYLYELPIGLTVSDVAKSREKLEYALKSRIEIRARNYLCEVKLITSTYDKLYKIDFKSDLLNGMRFNIGKCLNDNNMILDLTGSECHTLVCGSTGSGKSVFLNVLVTQMLLKGVDLYIIDFKRVEYMLYGNCYNVKTIDYIESQCEKTLSNLVKLMNERYKRLSVAKCKNYSDYNKLYDSKLKPVVLLIDEFSVISPKSQSYKYLFDLLARARACNIIVILATQRPDAKVITGSLKCNIKNTVVFRVENEVDSEIALSKKGDYRAFHLTDCGIGLLKSKGKVSEFKGYYMSDTELKEAIKSLEKPKEAVKPKQPVKPAIPTTKEVTLSIVTDLADIEL